MDLQDRRGLKAAAAEALHHAPQHRKLVLLWAGASALASLLASLLTLLLDSGIAATGGLSGIGTRNILSTAQSVLSLAVTVLLPFWTLGYTRLTLQLGRREPADAHTLLSGFRRFGPALRLLLVQAVLYIGLAMACFSIGSTVLMMTPLAEPLYETMLPLMESAGTELVLTDAVMASLMEAMLPVILGCTVIYLIVLIPVAYRLRMADLVLMDDPRCGALAALRASTGMLRRNCWKLFRLDLSFWWFYLAEALVAVLCYGDVLLGALGISLPLSAEAAYFVFYALAMAAQVGLYYGSRNQVSVTYALAYDSLRTPPAQPPKPQTPNVPWNY